MDNITYVARAIETESPFTDVALNVQAFKKLSAIIIAAGNILDQIKKNAFYGRDYNAQQINEHLFELYTNITNLHAHDIVNRETHDQVAANIRILHSIVGVVTESCELLQGLDVTKDDIDRVNLLEEIGDLTWYQALAIDELKSSFDQVFDANIAKLQQKRNKGNRFNADATINRDVDDERAFLERTLN